MDSNEPPTDPLSPTILKQLGKKKKPLNLMGVLPVFIQNGCKLKRTEEETREQKQTTFLMLLFTD